MAVTVENHPERAEAAREQTLAREPCGRWGRVSRPGLPVRRAGAGTCRSCLGSTGATQHLRPLTSGGQTPWRGVSAAGSLVPRCPPPTDQGWPSHTGGARDRDKEMEAATSQPEGRSHVMRPGSEPGLDHSEPGRCSDSMSYAVPQGDSECRAGDKHASLSPSTQNKRTAEDPAVSDTAV